MHFNSLDLIATNLVGLDKYYLQDALHYIIQTWITKIHKGGVPSITDSRLFGMCEFSKDRYSSQQKYAIIWAGKIHEMETFSESLSDPNAPRRNYTLIAIQLPDFLESEFKKHLNQDWRRRVCRFVYTSRKQRWEESRRFGENIAFLYG